MLRIVLYEPEIPPNTGNIIRLCANIGAELHLIEPLGFKLDEKRLRRAGLDYHEYAAVAVHPNLPTCMQKLGDGRYLACTTKGSKTYAEVSFGRSDILLFGPETRGLPADVLESLPNNQRIKIPMLATSRSLNLSNAVAVIAYEAWRQMGFES